MTALQAFRRAAAGPVRRCLLQCAQRQQQQQQQRGLAAAALGARFNSLARSGGRGDAFRPSLPTFPFVSREASTARESGGRDPDGGLISILRSELDHERKTYSQPKEVTRGPPAPWTITDKKGHADVILRRSYGQEDIAVTCVYQADSYEDENRRDEDIAESDDEGHDAGGGSCVNMTITINKGANNPTLEISAASYGTQISIEHVYFWEDKDARDAVYDGPNFLQLDEELQEQFEKYIKTRGVNRDLSGYLFSVLADKEQREYMSWLQKVEDFLRQ